MTLQKFTFKAILFTSETLYKYRDIMGTVQRLGKIAKYFVKPGKNILAHTKPQPAEFFTCAMKDGALTRETQAALGDASLFVENLLKKQQPAAKQEVLALFNNLGSVKTIQNRPKGALSIETKLIRGLKKADNQTFTSMNDAVGCIEDGIGSRVITRTLDKLSKSQIDKMISAQNLSKEDAILLRKYIYQEAVPPHEVDKAFTLFEEFARPLVEARSKEVVDQLTLGILKNRIINNKTTLQELENSGLFRDDIIKRLSSEDILPINITEINNYRGPHGLAEFSNNQIRQLAMALGEDSGVVIISDARGLSGRWPAEQIEKLSSKSIKNSGYRTAQINVVHQNGALGEIQFRGEHTNMIGEYEHIAYDLRQDKNTLGEMFEPFSVAVKGLSKEEYNIYNQYLESCYNYYNRIELGLPAIKPKLPRQLPKVLSEESMKALHDTDHALQKELEKDFVRYFEAA